MGLNRVDDQDLFQNIFKVRVSPPKNEHSQNSDACPFIQQPKRLTAIGIARKMTWHDSLTPCNEKYFCYIHLQRFTHATGHYFLEEFLKEEVIYMAINGNIPFQEKYFKEDDEEFRAAREQATNNVEEKNVTKRSKAIAKI